MLPRALPQALRDAARRRWVPALVARHPRHRRALFCRWFVNESHAALALGLVGLVAAGRRRRAAVALLPYLALQVPRDAGRRIVRPRRLVRFGLAVLERLADSVRERLELRRELQSLTAQARLSRYVVTALPFLVAAVITIINPGYEKPLFDTGEGLALLVFTVALVTLGSLWMRRITDIEV